jgi:hypothetical protein
MLANRYCCHNLTGTSQMEMYCKKKWQVITRQMSVLEVCNAGVLITYWIVNMSAVLTDTVKTSLSVCCSNTGTLHTTNTIQNHFKRRRALLYLHVYKINKSVQMYNHRTQELIHCIELHQSYTQNIFVLASKKWRWNGKRIALQHRSNVQVFVHRCSIYGLLFFTEKTMTVISYPDMLILFLKPQLQQDTEVADIQQDALSLIITAGSHLSFMPHSPSSGLAEVDLYCGRHCHPTSHPLIFISGATSRAKFSSFSFL